MSQRQQELHPITKRPYAEELKRMTSKCEGCERLKMQCEDCYNEARAEAHWDDQHSRGYR